MFRKNNKQLKLASRPSEGPPRKSRRVELLTRKGLLPPSIKDDELATIHFQREFRSRFGALCPHFFTGSLGNAVITSAGKNLDEERLLAIYLHHDASTNGDYFSNQLLCSQVAFDVLSRDFVVWGWDVTDDSNKQRFLVKSSGILDRSTIYDLTRAHKDRYPIMLILRCRRNVCRVQKRIEGNVNLEDFLSTLSEEASYAEKERKITKENDNQRAIRQRILDRQRMEYEESLRADREKDRRKEKQVEINRINSANEVKMKELEIQQREQAEKEKNKLKKVLPKEPGFSRNVIKIRLRKPCGDGCLTRKFSKSDKLKDLLNFVASEGYPLPKYRIISVCPRREISSLNPKRHLSSYGLARQETLIIEEK